MHRFSKRVGATSKLYEPEEWHIPNSTQNGLTIGASKLNSLPRRPGDQWFLAIMWQNEQTNVLHFSKLHHCTSYIEFCEIHLLFIAFISQNTVNSYRRAKPEFSPSITMGLDSHIPHTLQTTNLVQQDQLLSISLGPDCFIVFVCLLNNGFLWPLAAWHFKVLQVWHCKENLSK